MSRRRLLPALLATAALLLVVRPAVAKLALRSLAVTQRAHKLRLDVTSEQHPDAAAVTILQRVEKTLTYDGKQIVRVHTLRRMLRDAGADAEARIFVPAGGNLEVAARTISPTGEIVWLAGSDIHRAPIRSRDPLATAEAELCTFAFPAAESGAYFESVYELTTSRGLLADTHLFDGPEPVQVAQYQLSHPSDKTFRFFTSSGASPAAIKEGRTRSVGVTGRPLKVAMFELRNLPARPRESFALEATQDRAHLLAVDQTDSDSEQRMWRELAAEVVAIEAATRFGLERERAFARGQALSKTSRDARAQTIVRYLERKLEIVERLPDDIRTVDDVMKAGVVTQLGFGQILVALLDAASVPAEFGLVNSAHNLDLDQRVPWSGFFDRWLVVARGDSRYLFFDLESRDLTTGVPRWDVQGRPMLLAIHVDDRKAETKFVTVPRSTAQFNTLERWAKVRVTRDGSASVSIEESHRGEEGFLLGDRIEEQGREPVRRSVLSALRGELPELDVNAVRMNGSERSGFQVSTRFATTALTYHTPDGLVLDLTPLTLIPLLRELSTTPASERFLGVDFGYPQTVKTTVDVELDGLAAGALPKAIRLDGPGLRYARAVRKQGAGFTLSVTLTVTDPWIEADELDAFEALLNGVARSQIQAVPLR